MGLNKKGMYIALGSMSFLIASGAGVSAYDSYQIKMQLQEEQVELANKKTALEQSRKKALIEKFSGINPAYIDYAYDSSIVLEKLSDKDYTNEEKIVFLTFDDSPSSSTKEILEVLDKHDVKATFFVLGKEIENGGEEAQNTLKEIYNAGHSIGNHTYSQSSRVLFPRSKANVDNFAEELDKTNSIIQESLGIADYKTRIFRVPGSTTVWRGMQPLKDYASANNLIPIDWNVSNNDSVGKNKTVEQLVEQVTSSSKDKDLVVVQMHDTNSKENTVKSLPEIIKWYKDNGYTFKTLG